MHSNNKILIVNKKINIKNYFKKPCTAGYVTTADKTD